MVGNPLTGERAVSTSTQVGASGVTERWTGNVAPDRLIAATSNSSSSRAPIQGAFSGRIVNGVLTLSGKQSYTPPRGGGTSTRDCTVSARR